MPASFTKELSTPSIHLLCVTRGSPRPGIDEAIVPSVAEDDVIEDADTDELTRIAEALGELDVLCARRRVAARVIVSQEQRSGVAGDCRLEDLSWVDDRRRERSDGDRVDSDRSVLRVE